MPRIQFVCWPNSVADEVTLLDYLAEQIALAATPDGAEALRRDIARWETDGVTTQDITLCAAPAYAWISSLDEKGNSRRIRNFRSAISEPVGGPRLRSARRLTTINLDLILVAGQLLADTLARSPVPTLIPDVSPGSGAEGNATPETTKAAGPGSHNGLQRDVSGLAHQTAPLNKEQSNAGEGGGQPFSKPAVRESRTRQLARPPTNSHRSATNGPHWHDTASP